MQARLLWIVAASCGLGVMLAPANSGATALCKTKKGGLVIRDTCKKKEVQVDASLLGSLGLQGPAGPSGLQGPAGPAGGGLTVADAGGQDVGIVYSIGSGYYGGTYTKVMREMTAPGASGSEFFAFGVDPNGFVAQDDYYGYGIFTTPDCSGTKYAGIDCEYGACDVPPMFENLTIDSQQVGSFSRASERVHGNYFASSLMSSSSADGVTTSCTQVGGTLLGSVTACQKSPQNFCGTCCVPRNDTDAAPLHTIDLSTLGLTPPFKLRR
jgi:hypothetical protein